MKPAAYEKCLRVLTSDAYLGTIRRAVSPEDRPRRGPKADPHDGEFSYVVELDIGRETVTYPECQLTPIGGYAYDVGDLGLKF
jgi:hypothetical protein